MHVCTCVCMSVRTHAPVYVCVRERQDETDSLFPMVVNKHTSVFLHSAFAQRGTNLFRIHTAFAILHTRSMCGLSIKTLKEK